MQMMSKQTHSSECEGRNTVIKRSGVENSSLIMACEREQAAVFFPKKMAGTVRLGSVSLMLRA